MLLSLLSSTGATVVPVELSMYATAGEVGRVYESKATPVVSIDCAVDSNLDLSPANVTIRDPACKCLLNALLVANLTLTHVTPSYSAEHSAKKVAGFATIAA